MHKKIVAVLVALVVAVAAVAYPIRAKALVAELALGTLIGSLLVGCGLSFASVQDLERTTSYVEGGLDSQDKILADALIAEANANQLGADVFSCLIPEVFLSKVYMLSVQAMRTDGNTTIIDGGVFRLPASYVSGSEIVFEHDILSSSLYQLGTYNGIRYELLTGLANEEGKFNCHFITYIGGHSISFETGMYVKTSSLKSLTLKPMYTTTIGMVKRKILMCHISGVSYDGSTDGLIIPYTSSLNSGWGTRFTIDGVKFSNFDEMCEYYGKRASNYIDGSNYYYSSFIYDVFYVPSLNPIDVVINDDYFTGDVAALGQDVIGAIHDLVGQGVQAQDVISGRDVIGDLADVLNPSNTISVSIPNSLDDVQSSTADDILTDTQDVPKPPPDLDLPEIPRNIFTDKFPFCLPFDLYNAVEGLVVPAEPPKFVMPMKIGNWLDEEITIDFEQFSPLAAICRWGFSFIFVVSLIKISRKMIGAE